MCIYVSMCVAHSNIHSTIGSVTIWNWDSWLRKIRCCVPQFLGEGRGLLAMPHPRTWLGTQRSQANGTRKRHESRILLSSSKYKDSRAQPPNYEHWMMMHWDPKRDVETPVRPCTLQHGIQPNCFNFVSSVPFEMRLIICNCQCLLL